MTELTALLRTAFAARQALIDDEHASAFRLFNGFLEGLPTISIDIFGRTALIHNYSDSPGDDQVPAAEGWISATLPWVRCIISKTREGQTAQQKRGMVIYGDHPDTRVCENGVWYAIDLEINRDASLYLDTRNLRRWAKDTLGGKTVLNTFAYTGSLGVAALAGGAGRVIQVDRNRNFLSIAEKSYLLNNLPINKGDFLVDDFFSAVGRFKHNRQLFDCVFLDPPFYSATSKGTVDLLTNNARLINKVRPLIKNDGWLVAINNALFLNGLDYLATLESLCADGYLSIEQLIPVAEDFTGIMQTRAGSPPVDPAPFNHSTKIAILRVKRK